jgi:hypothetical protein
MADNETPKKPKRTVNKDLLRDPVVAQRMYEQRVRYFNDPLVRRAMALERAEKIEPKGKPN